MKKKIIPYWNRSAYYWHWTRGEKEADDGGASYYAPPLFHRGDLEGGGSAFPLSISLYLGIPKYLQES